MQADNFSLKDYFERIGYAGPANADIACLRQIMQAQLFSIPFENLDVQAGNMVSMVPQQMVDKLIYRQRGGYCYEVNALFAMLLQALDIPYRLIAARPMFYSTPRPRTHMVVLADIEQQQWLFDLGFGSYGIREPIGLHQLDCELPQSPDIFKLSQTHDGDYLLQAKVNGEWCHQFSFDLSPFELIDFIPANYFNSTHPDAVFVQKLLVVKHHPQGRHILFGDRLKTVTAAGVNERILDKSEIEQTLAQVFGLSLAG